MKIRARAVSWLVLLGCILAGTAHAAVMTTNVRVTGSAVSGFNINYTLAQDASAMTVKIYNASNTLVRTLNVTDATFPGALMKGKHDSTLGNAVLWDAKTSGGTTAPAGDYYAVVETTGAAVTGMTELVPATMLAFTIGSKTWQDGRFYYGHGVSPALDSPYRNMDFIASVTQNNNTQVKGLWVAGADATAIALYPAESQTINFDYISADTLDDGRIVVTDQSTGLVRILNPDGTTYKTLGGAGTEIYTRTVQAFGNADNAKLVFIDVGSTGASNVNGVSMLDTSISPQPAPTILVPAAIMPSTARDMAVKADLSAIYVSGRGTGAALFVAKFTRQGDGSYIRDTNFNWTPVPGSTPVNLFVRLSPDEQTLWVGFNDGNSTDVSDKGIVGVDPNTGAAKGANYLINLTWNPEQMAVSHNGNIYAVSYSGNLTGTTGDGVGIVAPPDSGSTDAVRSFPFSVTNDTTIDITAGPTAADITFHSAKINWTTDLPGDSVVRFGTSPGFYGDPITVTDATTDHSVTLEDLEQNTTYYYQVESNAEGFTPAVSTERTFKTNALTITNIQVTDITATAATVTWTTSEPSTSLVNYGTLSGAPDKNVTDNTLVTAHSVRLTSLLPQTQYFFNVESGWTTAGLLRTVSAESSFTTKAEIILQNLGLNVTQNSATLTFDTSAATSAVVKFGTARDALTGTINVPSGTTHSAAFTGLAPNTTYYYTMDLAAGDGATLTTPVSAFHTLVAGGATTTVTHSTAADLLRSNRTQIDLGAAGGLVTLQRQSIPGTPIDTTPIPEERYYQGVAIHGGFIYVIGGRNNLASGNSRDTVYYAPINADGSVGAWNTTTPLPAARIAIADMTFGYGDYIYVVGGADAGFISLNTVIYAKQNADGTLGPWQATSSFPLPEGRDLGTAVAVDGYVLLSGGENNVSSPDTDPAQFMAQIQGDGSLGPWYEIDPLPTPRWFGRTRVNAHKVYSLGGYDYVSTNTFVNRAEVAGVQPNGSITAWQIMPDLMSTTRFSFAAALVGGKLMTIQGRYGANVATDEIEYTKIKPDGTTGSWVVDPNKTSTAAMDLDGKTYNGRTYTVGGRTVFAGGAAAAAVPNVTIIPMVPDAADPDGATYVYSGSLESNIIDFGAATNLKRLQVAATGGTVEIRYRFAGPDGVFTDWLTLSGTAADITGGARYFQYQLVLSGSGTSTPTVTSVTITTEAGAGPVLTVDDIKRAISIASGQVSATAADKTKLDANGDGSITLEDAARLNRTLNGL